VGCSGHDENDEQNGEAMMATYTFTTKWAAIPGRVVPVPNQFTPAAPWQLFDTENEARSALREEGVVIAISVRVKTAD
jgi:hypothetical protein